MKATRRSGIASLIRMLSALCRPSAPSIKSQGVAAASDRDLGGLILAMVPSAVTKYGTEPAYFMNSALLMLANAAARLDLAPVIYESVLAGRPIRLSVWRHALADGTPCAPAPDAFATLAERVAPRAPRQISGAAESSWATALRNARAVFSRWPVIRRCALASWPVEDIGALARPIATALDRVSYVDALHVTAAAVFVVAEMEALHAGTGTIRITKLRIGEEDLGDWSMAANLGSEAEKDADVPDAASVDRDVRSVVLPGGGPAVAAAAGRFERLQELSISTDTSGAVPAITRIALRGTPHKIEKARP